MKVILQKDLFERSKPDFEKASREHGIVFQITERLDEQMMLHYHQKGISCFVIGAENYSTEFYETLAEGTAVIRYGVGYNAIPIDICRQRNIKVGYTPGTLTDSVAEHTFALLLATTRRIAYLNQSVHDNRWEGVTGMELKNKTLAIIGFGAIGKAVAKIAKHGFGMRVKAYDIKLSEDREATDLLSNNFEEVVKDADFVSLHMASNKETQGFIDKRRISKMKSGVIFINTSRGELVNEADLFVSLKNQKIKAAGLDVFLNEPYVPSNDFDLRRLDNVTMTPHCGSNTTESNTRMAEMVIKNILAYYSEGEMMIIPELN